MSFEDYEIDYLRDADLGRLATVDPGGQPQASPVGFTYNDELGTIDVRGYGMTRSRKYRNVASHPEVAFVVDDIRSRDPWRVRCLEIRGTAEQVAAPESTGPAGDQQDGAIIRITPRRIISFGIHPADADVEPHRLSTSSRDA